MNYELEYLIGKAEIRTRSIPELLEQEKVFSPGNPKAAVATTYFWRMFLRERNIKGQQNLERAASAYSPEDPLTVAVRHSSDIDTQFLEQALRFGGAQEFANKAVYIAGLNMNERAYIRLNTLGGNRIFVETPLIMDDLNELLGDETKELSSRRLLGQFKGYGVKLNYAAGHEVRGARSRGHPIIVYPEATRSPDGFIKKAHPSTGFYFTEGITLPVMIRGSEKFLPPKKIPPIHRWIFSGGVVDLEYGVPFHNKTIQARDVRVELRRLGARPVDLVMARIGRMDWDRVDPVLRPFYQELDERFPTIPLAA